MFEMIYDWVVLQLTMNDVFAGLVGGSLLMSALYFMRSVPNKLWAAFLHNFTCTVTVFNDDESFDWINTWLSEIPYSKVSRRLHLSSFTPRTNDDEDYTKSWSLAPGQGNHFFFYKRTLIWIIRESSGDSGTMYKRREEIKIRVLGRAPTKINELVAEAKSIEVGEEYLDIYRYTDYWSKHDCRARRSLDSVVVPTIKLENLVSDIEWFIKARSWYGDRGIPYRRGYLLSGPPGCGKTSLVIALASHFGKPIYVLNLGSLSNDDSLFNALSSVPNNAILLMEDIDVAQATKSRTKKKKKKAESNKLTMSGLLNGIDGVLSKEGRLLFMTTNHPETLDDAMVRPGRVDLHETIGLLDAEDAGRMFNRFFPGENALAGKLVGGLKEEISGAALQGTFMVHNDNPEKAVEVLIS